jgi:hypothetical protein
MDTRNREKAYQTDGLVRLYVDTQVLMNIAYYFGEFGRILIYIRLHVL